MWTDTKIKFIEHHCNFGFEVIAQNVEAVEEKEISTLFFVNVYLNKLLNDEESKRNRCIDAMFTIERKNL